MNGPGDFERELEQELHRILDPIAAAPIPFRRAPSGAIARRVLGGAGVALGLKLATGVAIAAFAAAAIGATTEVAVTGSLNPADWGQQVKTTVADCKAKLAAGQHGIGDCVSDFAKQHGDLVSDSHQASKARDNSGNDNGKDHGNGNGNPNGGGNGAGHQPTAPGKSETHTPPTH
jgi:hypothetical protein